MRGPTWMRALVGRFRVTHHGLLSRECWRTWISSTPLSPSSTPPWSGGGTVSGGAEAVCTIPGVLARTAVMLLAECGANMTVFRILGT